MHPDGVAEDYWVKAPLEDIANRFGVIEFKISSNEHRIVIDDLQRNAAERCQVTLNDARQHISNYRLGK